MAYLVAAAISKVAVEWFISGATCAISLYCGVKTPKKRSAKK